MGDLPGDSALPTELPRKLWRWWRLRSRRGLVVTGALPSREAAAFVERLRAGLVLPIPMDADRPEEADIVVIVGRISTRQALSVSMLRQRLPPGGLIVACNDPTMPATYACTATENVVGVDIVVGGLPPSASAINAVIRRLLPPTAGVPVAP